MIGSATDVGVPIDESHLDRVTLGNPMLATEVVSLFCRQTGELIEQLRTNPAEASVILHKIKGGAMAIGAQRVTDLILTYEGLHAGAELSGAQLSELQSEAAQVQAWLARRQPDQK